MTLAAGTRLGSYDIVGLIGAGGMGEVYRGRDRKLERDVAIKVLPAAFASVPERRARFEREARLLASLNHPHIASIYGFEETDGMFALVLELVEGPTLADLSYRPIPLTDALSFARQIADALEAAHDRGIIHRDLKPSNIKVTVSGTVKVLDFGLAKAFADDAAPDDSDSTTAADRTSHGAVMGTTAYMSPEQSRGKAVDKRTDIWAYGCVLYEMLTGRRAFAGDTSSDTVVAILERHPDWRALPPGTPASVVRVLQRCLEKDSRRRLRDIGDARFDLEPGAVVPADPPEPAATRPRAVSRRAALALAGVVVLAAAAGYLASMGLVRVPPPAYQQLTFRRGSVVSARFAGDNIVYSAAWDGGPAELWSMRPESPESRQLGIMGADILAVSPSGEMAIRVVRRSFSSGPGDMLARLPLNASTPREVLADVADADWAPDGQNLAVSHVSQGKHRLEFPIGTVLYESEGRIDGVRVSPDGEWVAFVDHPFYHRDDRGTVSITARTGGTTRALSGGWSSVTGLAWSPDGNEVWFTAAELGATTSLYAVDLSGRVRVVSRSANRMTIRDIDRNGRVLLIESRFRLRISAIDATRPNDAGRDLSWLDGSVVTDLSPDGGTLLINEQAAGGGTPLYAVYLRKSDGSPAIRIGDGSSPALSPDGRRVATILLRSPPSIVLLPTGAGQPQPLNRGPLVDYQAIAWFPDGRHLLLAGSEAGRPVRLWRQEVPDGDPMPISPDGLRIASFSRPISPDGARATAIDPDGRIWLHPLNVAGAPQLLTALEAGELPIRWDLEGRSFYVARQGEVPAVVYRFYPGDGRRERVTVLAPPDLAGVRTLASVQATPDGRLFTYSYVQSLSDLFLLSNVR